MPILIDDTTKVVVQGITGHQGEFHTKAMREYGTNIVAGVTPGKEGQYVHDVKVYNSMKDAVSATDANTSIVFVPAPHAKDACFEAIDSGIKLLVIITERIPFHDAIEIMSYAMLKNVIVIGPNTPGIITPGVCKVGIMPDHIFVKGTVGVISRSGTLTYEIVDAIKKLGQSTCVGIGGDPIIGLSFIDIVKMFESDDDTDSIVIIGEIGGTAEEELAEYVKKGYVSKPIVAYIAGQTAPSGKRMGHAGAIILRGKGTAQSKIKAFKSAGIKVAKIPSEISHLLS
jgi:succinyl-CoA synthetase alpha subunit